MTRPPVPPDNDWFYKLGVVVGIIILLGLLYFVVIGAIWLTKQVF